MLCEFTIFTQYSWFFVEQDMRHWCANVRDDRYVPPHTPSKQTPDDVFVNTTEVTVSLELLHIIFTADDVLDAHWMVSLTFRFRLHII